MFGFVDYNIDIVVKFGGSILQRPAECAKALQGIQELAKSGLRILVYPGSGPTDLTLEDLDRSYGFADSVHYEACLLAQDQTALMIADKTVHPGFKTVDSLGDALRAIRMGLVPVLLPSRLVSLVAPFEKTWAITSDSMAAWVTWLIGCKKLIVLKSVDGIFLNFEDPQNRILIETMTAQELIEMRISAVDECFGGFVQQREIDTYIINACRTEEIAKALAGERFFGTRVRP